MKVNVKLTVQKVQVIDNPKEVIAAEAGELYIGKKPVLIVKGGDTEQIAAIVYLRLNREKDSAGNRFVFSLKCRGLAHTDPIWGQRKKMSGPEFESYLADYFVFAEKVANANGPALILTERLPKFFSALMNQPRYTSKHVELFEMVP
jgi:hypothetical protein